MVFVLAVATEGSHELELAQQSHENAIDSAKKRLGCRARAGLLPVLSLVTCYCWPLLTYLFIFLCLLDANVVFLNPSDDGGRCCCGCDG